MVGCVCIMGFDGWGVVGRLVWIGGGEGGGGKCVFESFHGIV